MHFRYFYKTINPSIETIIVEKKLIEHIKSKPNLSKKYKYKKISFPLIKIY